MVARDPIKVIVIGAGWSGLVAAKTYLAVTSSTSNPHRRLVDLVILDENDSVGGVWSRSRLYPGLFANVPHGLYEYSDFSMVDENHPYLSLITGERVQEYLESYARRFGIYDKIRLNTVVASISRTPRREGSGWKVVTTVGEELQCDKLIVASGLYSKLRLPLLPTSTYTGMSIHSRHLGEYASRLASDPDISSVVVVGAAKSALEAVNLCLEYGKQVSWVVRPSDKGVPMAIIDPDAKPNLLAIATARLFNIASPSPWATSGFWYNFLHSGTWFLGTLLMYAYWRLMTFVLKREAKYSSSQNGQSIEPRGRSFFYDTTFISPVLKESRILKVLHEDNPQKLLVHRATPTSLQQRTLTVIDAKRSGNVQKDLPADAVIWCTGWQSTLGVFDDNEAWHLGLPTAQVQDPSEESEWSARVAKARIEVESKFPALRSGRPRGPSEAVNTLPIRLYRNILPPNCLSIDSNSGDMDRSIVFTAFTSSSQTPITFEIGALWAVAWLEGILPRESVPTKDSAMQSIAELQAFRVLRYGLPSKSEFNVLLEVQGLHDQLMTDLGLETERHKMKVFREKEKDIFTRIRGNIREWTQPYRASDYAGLIEEFLAASFPEKKKKK